MRSTKFIGLLTGLILLAASNTTQAQCVPNPSVPGVGFFTTNLDSILDTAVLNMPYTEVITVVAPTTWQVGPPIGSVNIDSVLIVSITNQPAGISIVTNPSLMLLAAGDTGCIQFAGTPTDPADQGENILLVKFRAWGFGIPYNEDVTDFSIYLKDPTSIESSRRNDAAAVQFFPNPAKSTINFKSESELLKFELISVLGETVVSVDHPTDSYSLESLPSGLYLIRLENSEGITEDRLIVQ